MSTILFYMVVFFCLYAPTLAQNVEVAADDPVQTQYTHLPYPPRDPLDEINRLITDVPSHPAFVDHFIHNNRRVFTAEKKVVDEHPLNILIAGGGTGDVLIYLLETFTLHPNLACNSANIYHLDFSSASINIARRRLEERKFHIPGSTNNTVRFVHGSLLDLATDQGRISLGLSPTIQFDFINACGVLHHLETPTAGLQALNSVLSPSGGMFIMLYGRYGRSGIYEIQDVVSQLRSSGKIRTQSDCLSAVKHFLLHLPGLHPLRTTTLAFQTGDHWNDDAEIYDIFCHERDVAFTVEELFNFIQEGGEGDLVMTGFQQERLYRSGSYIEDTGFADGLFENADDVEEFKMAEQLAGVMSKHQFYVSRKSADVVPRYIKRQANISAKSPTSIYNTVMCAASQSSYDQYTKDQWGKEFQQDWKKNETSVCNLSAESIAVGLTITLVEQVNCFALHLLTRLDCSQTLGDIWREIRASELAGGVGDWFADWNIVSEKFADVSDKFFDLGIAVPLPPAEAAVPVLEIGDRLDCSDDGCDYSQAFATGMLKVSRCGPLCDVDTIGAIMSAAQSLWTVDDSSMPAMTNNRGYISTGSESGVKDKFFERKRGFSYGRDVDVDAVVSNSMEGKNLWSTDFEGRKTLEDAFEMLCLLAERIARDVLVQQGFETEKIDEILEGGRNISLARVFHYFGDDSDGGGGIEHGDDGRTKIGSSPHTDWGFLTIILEDVQESGDNGGLEFYDGWLKKWTKVDPVESTVTVNFGDYLQSVSNNTISSPIHRVSLGKRDRTSLVFFYYPSFESEMIETNNKREAKKDFDYNTCVDGGSATETTTTATTMTTTFGEWIANKWKQVKT
mgnify:FL=1